MTWGQIRVVLRKFAPGFDLELLTAYISQAYEEILGERDWKGLEATATLVTNPVYSTGTVDLTAGSNAVSGTGTVFNSAMTGRRFHIPGENTTYVFSYLSATQGQLDRNYEGETKSGSAYRIFQNLYSLPEQVNYVQEIYSEYLGRPLDKWKQEDLRFQLLYFDRPMIWAPAQDTDEGVPPVQAVIELYPAPLYQESLTYTYQKRPLGFDGSNTDYSPLPWVPPGIIIDKVKAKILNDQGQFAAADRFELKAQREVSKLHLQDSRRGRPSRIEPDER